MNLIYACFVHMYMYNICSLHEILQLNMSIVILYSQKIWRGIKIGGLAILGETAKLKFYTACMYTYVWYVPDRQI